MCLLDNQKPADQSDRQTDKPWTTWTSAKPRKVMSVNGRSFSVPTSVQAIPSKGLIDKPLIMDQYPPLTHTDKDERLRMYHARLDLLQTIVNPDQADLDWQVETILEWTTKATKKGDQVMFEVNWIGGDKQWVNKETLRLHDLYLAVKLYRTS